MAVESPSTSQIPVAGGAAVSGSAGPSGNVDTKSSKRPGEVVLYWLFAACALLTVGTTFGIIAVLLLDSLPFFREHTLTEFLTGTVWSPKILPQQFGVLPLVAGTLLVTAGAALLALPMGLLVAIYLSEYASPTMRRVLKPVLELLAGVPTVVYGFFALTFITPILQNVGERLTPVIQRLTGNPDFYLAVEGLNALSASIAVAIMTLPLVSSLCEDAIYVVPRSLREGAYALGATKMEVSLKVVVPAALSGIAAAFILAISRAVGETMIVALAAGASPNLTANPLNSVLTMTGYIVNVSRGDAPYGTIEYQTIYAVGLLLFCMTVALNLASVALVKKYRHRYD